MRVVHATWLLGSMCTLGVLTELLACARQRVRRRYQTLSRMQQSKSYLGYVKLQIFHHCLLRLRQPDRECMGAPCQRLGASKIHKPCLYYCMPVSLPLLLVRFRGLHSCHVVDLSPIARTCVASAARASAIVSEKLSQTLNEAIFVHVAGVDGERHNLTKRNTRGRAISMTFSPSNPGKR